MMKKLLIVIAAIALLAAVAYVTIAWVISRFWAEEAVTAAAARPWPAGMGTLEAVDERFPPLPANDASVKLTALVNAVPKNEAVDDFVRREIVRGAFTVGEPPALPDVSPIRELLLREPIVWKRRDGIGGDDDSSAIRAMQM